MAFPSRHAYTLQLSSIPSGSMLWYWLSASLHSRQSIRIRTPVILHIDTRSQEVLEVENHFRSKLVHPAVQFSME